MRSYFISPAILRKLLNWSTSNGGDLPWRQHEDRNLYHTYVSEVMLQQTTVGAVIPKFLEFIGELPDLQSLACASEQKIMTLWTGLGYYRRARNLHKGAQYFWHHHQEIPNTYNQLIQAPGVGEYTANAILAIGMDKNALAIDANILRVLSRFFGLSGTRSYLEKQLKEKFSSALFAKAVTYRGLHESLMDVGRLLCRSHNVECGGCPLAKECIAYRASRFDYLFDNKSKKNYDLQLLRWLVIEQGKILLIKKQGKQWLEGQWELPTSVVSCSDANFGQYPVVQSWERKQLKKTSHPATVKTTITQYKITNTIAYSPQSDSKLINYLQRNHGARFISLSSLTKLPIAHQTRRFIHKILNQDELSLP